MTAPQEPLGADGKPDDLGSAPTEAASKSDRRRQTAESFDQPVSDELSGEPLHVFTAGTSPVSDFGGYLRGVWSRRRFMLQMAQADLNQKRSKTALGGLWDLLDPIFQAGIYYLLFTIIRSGGRPDDFIPTLFGSILLFQLTTSALTAGGNSMRSSSALMLNSTFPRAVLPLSRILSGLLSLRLGAVVYLAFAVIMGSDFTLAWLWFPLLFTLNMLLMMGLAFGASTLIVFVPDVKNAMPYITRLLFFTTPVFYPVEILPEKMAEYLQWHPLFRLFVSYQRMMSGEMPFGTDIVGAAIWAVALFLVGSYVFLRYEREFASRL